MLPVATPTIAQTRRELHGLKVWVLPPSIGGFLRLDLPVRPREGARQVRGADRDVGADGVGLPGPRGLAAEAVSVIVGAGPDRALVLLVVPVPVAAVDLAVAIVGRRRVPMGIFSSLECSYLLCTRFSWPYLWSGPRMPTLLDCRAAWGSSLMLSGLTWSGPVATLDRFCGLDLTGAVTTMFVTRGSWMGSRRGSFR